MMSKFISIIVVALVYIAIAILWPVYRDRISIEHGAGLVAALSSFAGTLYVMIGVWLSQDEIYTLNNLPLKSPELVRRMKKLFLGAHHQLLIGMLLLLLGFAAQVIAVLAGILNW